MIGSNRPPRLRTLPWIALSLVGSAGLSALVVWLGVARVSVGPLPRALAQGASSDRSRFDLPPAPAAARDRAWLERHPFRPLPDPLERNRPGRPRSGAWPLETDLRLRYDFDGRWLDTVAAQVDRLILTHRILVDRFGPEPVVFAWKDPATGVPRDAVTALAQVVATFNEVWAVSDEARQSTGASRVADAIADVERTVEPLLETSARESVSELFTRRRGEWRRGFLGVRAEAESKGLEQEGRVLDDHYEALTTLSRIAHQHSRPFYSTAFAAVEEPYLEARLDTPIDVDTSEMDARRVEAEQTIAELQGRTLVEIMKRVRTPGETLGAKSQRAESGIRARVDEAVAALDEIDRRCAERLGALETRAHEEIETLLTQGGADDPLSARSALWPAYPAMIRLSREALEEFERETERTLRRLESDLLEAVDAARLEFRSEAASFENDVAPRSEEIRREIRETSRLARESFREFTDQVRLLPKSGFRNWKQHAFDSFPTAAMARGLGYPVTPDTKLVFAEKWLRENGEELELQLQGLVQLHRLPPGLIDPAELRRLTSTFNLMWSRTSVDAAESATLTQTLTDHLRRHAPVFEQLARIELTDCRREVWLRWRRIFTERSTELRVLAAQLSNQFRTVIPESTLAVVRDANQRAAESLATNLGRLGDVEADYYDALARTRDASDRAALETEKSRALGELDLAITEGLESLQAESSEAITAIRQSAKEKTSGITSTLDLALARLDRLETQLQQDLDRVARDAETDLAALLGPLDGRPSLYRYRERFSRIGRHLQETDQQYFLVSERYRKELEALTAELREDLQAFDATTGSAIDRRRALERVGLRLAVRCQEIVDRTRRAFRRVGPR